MTHTPSWGWTCSETSLTEGCSHYFSGDWELTPARTALAAKSFSLKWNRNQLPCSLVLLPPPGAPRIFPLSTWRPGSN